MFNLFSLEHYPLKKQPVPRDAVAEYPLTHPAILTKPKIWKRKKEKIMI